MPRYKSCFVPCCKNTTVTAPQKLYISVPSVEPQRSQWIEIVRGDDIKRPSFSRKSSFYVCEDHFDIENDVENLLFARMFAAQNRNIVIRLKPGVIPSKFGNQTGKQRGHSVAKTIEQNGLLNGQGTVSSCLNESTCPVHSTSNAVHNVFPLTRSTSTFSTAPSYRDIGIQAQPFYQNVAIQSKLHYYRSKAVQVAIKTTSVSTSPVKPRKTPRKRRKICHRKEEEERECADNGNSEQPSDAGVMTSSGSFSVKTRVALFDCG